MGSLFDVSFVLNGETLAKINTGEWTYLEVPSGDHQFRVGGGLLDTNVPVNFEEGNNYFFRGFLSNGAGYAIWVHDQSEIDEAIKNIESGRYKQIPSLDLHE